MAEKIDIAMPEELVIGDGWQIVWAAVDSAGAAVSGVLITEANVVAADLSAGDTVSDVVGPFMLVPGPGA